MINKGDIYIKNRNGLEFIVTDIIGNSIEFHEKHYFNSKIMDKESFLDQFTLKKEEE